MEEEKGDKRERFDKKGEGQQDRREISSKQNVCLSKTFFKISNFFLLSFYFFKEKKQKFVAILLSRGGSLNDGR